ncbi:MAG: hypothetical protein OXH83_02680 [Bryobacterales bacterium]|nr:hypothetical protein [Bryobacterales bacterium]
MKNDGKDGTIRIGTWNTCWRVPNGNIGKIIQGALARECCDVLCVTEGFEGILPNGGHVIDAGADWGCPIKKGRRKVLLWSKRPWTPHTHALGLEEFHKGRFVAGTTDTASGACLTVIGVCIPWKLSHVTFCKKDLQPWEDHKRWLAGFQMLRSRFPKSRTVVLGDFNQRMPNENEEGKFVPTKIHNALLLAFDGLKFATNEELPDGLRAIDHIVHTPDLTLTPSGIKVWPKYSNGLKPKLSDHFGVWGDFGFS